MHSLLASASVVLAAGPFATLFIKCAVGRVVPLLVFGTDGKLKNQVPKGLPAAGMSNIGRTGGSGVLA